MTQEDIIRMAREAGYFLYDLTETHGKKTVETDTDDEWLVLERFAALVRADERANLYKEMNDPLVEMGKKLVADEREACAKVCDDINAKYKWPQDTAERVASQWCADAIRARGQA